MPLELTQLRDCAAIAVYSSPFRVRHVFIFSPEAKLIPGLFAASPSTRKCAAWLLHDKRCSISESANIPDVDHFMTAVTLLLDQVWYMVKGLITDLRFYLLKAFVYLFLQLQPNLRLILAGVIDLRRIFVPTAAYMFIVGTNKRIRYTRYWKWKMHGNLLTVCSLIELSAWHYKKSSHWRTSYKTNQSSIKCIFRNPQSM